MNNKNPEELEMFSRQWYDEYFRRAASSATHAEFCQKVYGKNLCQHGLMDMVELDFLVSLIKPGTKILELGCSNGYLTEYIHEQTQSEILGLDYSKIAIEQAKERKNHKAKTLEFRQVDLTKEEIPGKEYDYIILIDAIYFLGDFQEISRKLNAKLAYAGSLIVTYFEVYDEDKENTQLPGPDNTWLAQAFGTLDATYTWYDFTENVRAHSIKNYQVGEELRAAFIKEGNQFLYEARAAENRFFKESAEKEAIVRYMYVVNRFCSA
jgi:2-polyprenyl-3-methyl-5-hydroxy-6-metoxy-1,4-benzoquinol methylase